MIEFFRTDDLVSWVSKFCTLKPGDLILTGTPPGVGVFKKPPEFLKVTKFKIDLSAFIKKFSSRLGTLLNVESKILEPLETKLFVNHLFFSRGQSKILFEFKIYQL